MFSFDEVKNYDPEIAAAMNDELKRQQDHIELIASENIVSKAVMSAMGSILTERFASQVSSGTDPAEREKRAA